ncbi:hypothetical protein C1Y40_02475 [Mycobacterium talmoniae]|uniref:Uncharacterized protein n=1 Tax=Mycobacterium talmoniae TaxID=1858794 RepID=A0A2S8BL41_9MYCO|nr:hypothetical protein C1Y40_02475 [Mycobacterium talmoniae]
MNQPRVLPRRCSPNTVALVPPAAAICPNSASRCSTESVRYGNTGATITWQSSPASRIAAISPSRACGVGVPGSMSLCSAGSATASDTATETATFCAAAVISGRSRRSRVPLVRMENGVPDSASAPMMPGISA